MSEQPERPAQPGAETHLTKSVVGQVQAALDATFNALRSDQPGSGTATDPAAVEQHLRRELEQQGVNGGVTDAWVAEAAQRMAAGEPVAAQPGDA